MASDWALKPLSTLLPLDTNSLSQILAYTSTLSKDDAASHLRNLLGNSSDALDFINLWNARRTDEGVATTAASTTSASNPISKPSSNPTSNELQHVPKSTRKTQKRKPPLHQLPSRKIDDHGDISGGYQKGREGNEYMGASSRRQYAGPASTGAVGAVGAVGTVGGGRSNAFALSGTPVAQQLPKKTAGGKLPPSAAGGLISDLQDVRQKSQSQGNSRTASPTTKTKTKITVQGGVAGKGASSTLEDLDAAIRSLEIQTNPSLSSTSDKDRTCNCNAQRHPLLAAAPNCLNCGKIICLHEGIGPCTFCHTPLLSPPDIQAMLDSLKQERGTQRQQLHNVSQKRASLATSYPSSPARSLANSPAPSSRLQQSTASANTSGGKGLESALAHRNKLLGFQADNTQRTTVHDEAADVAAPESVNRWADPAERARQLREQQKAMKEQEERMRPEWEKRGRVLNIEVGKGGKVVRTVRMGEREREKEGLKETEEQGVGGGEGAREKEEAKEEMIGEGEEAKVGRFARNPLLEADMVRPIWEGGKGKGRADGGAAITKAANGGADQWGGNARMRGWRKLEDNEDIILNGGAGGRGKRLGNEERAVAW